MSIGTSKEDLIKTLEYFDVNRVIAMPAQDFLKKKFPPKKLWGIRSIDKRGGGGLFIHARNTELTKYMLRNLPSKGFKLKDLIVCESMKYYDDNHLIANGEVMYYKASDTCWIYNWTGWISREKGLSVRAAQDSGSRKEIYGRFQVPDIIIDYVLSKRLIGYVIEFSMYDKPVGIKNQSILIWEIRRY